MAEDLKSAAAAPDAPAGEVKRRRRRRGRGRRAAPGEERPGDPAGGDRLRHLGWLNLLDAYLGHLNMPVARARVQAEFEALESGAELPAPAVLDPRAPAGVIRARFAELRALERMYQAAAGHPDAEGLRGALAGLEDLLPSFEAAKRGETLDLLELVGCADLLAADLRMRSALTIAQNRSRDDRDLDAFATRYGASSTELELLSASLERAIERQGDEGPTLSDRASPALAEARGKLKGAKGRIVRVAEKLLRRADVADSLQDSFWTEREGRVVLPAKSGGLGPFKRGGAIIHGSSASGQTIFVEPRELVELNNELREAQSRFRSERSRILKELSGKLAEHAELLGQRQWALVELAFIDARLRLSQELEGVEPQWMGLEDDDARVWLPAARHPNMLLDGVEVVPNDLELRVGQALVISGPNAGGKTVALKTLGLCLLMARTGLRIPTAQGARLPLYTRIVTDVGDDQSIQADLSTFSAQIVHIREALAAAQQVHKGCLVLLDEIAVGTDPEQGAALAESVLLELVRRGASVVVTTHYERLKLLARSTEDEVEGRFVNAAVGFDLQALRPTFTLTMGVPGSSSALAVARRLGLDTQVIDRAENLLDDAALKVDVLLQAIAQERVALTQTRKALEHDREIVARRSAKLKKKQQSAEQGARSRKQRAWERAAEQLHGLEKELKVRRRHIRKAGGSIEEVPTRHEATADARAKLEDEREAAPRPEGQPPRKVEVGMIVGLPSMGQKGEVVAVKGKRVTVQLEHLRTTVKADELRLPPPEPVAKKNVRIPEAEALLNFGSKARAHFGEDPKAVVSGIDNSIDLVGERADVGCERMEDFLAEALSRDQDVVVLRHGHGSGILRKALRERLNSLRHVRRYRGGISAEGGDAVTVVWLDT